ncbi:hypothetical protein Acav_2106 [Paracidovorax avenae ATCC 19860]|uniref:Secreted protein n=1 Tax=Paracidovorax avenae (strain ATCC 19860 / DSM 7227 / CCUG 15838 / JCM 20985 / LMG 2117 / NCPPB 1011) TaxID=643561 RepID=F0Q9V3_PARA1|nr:hypothetical protein [Paracidovorax avenae]ADX46018.1 hypothetical protein Acav_2106 [Paracidovorax avenae ATCC 19860]
MIGKKHLAGLGVLVALMSGNAYAVNCGAGQTKHYIKVSSSGQTGYKWSVFADLAAGNGVKVYHWEETDKPYGSSTYWEYCDGHDNGRLYVWIHPTGVNQFEYLNLPLGTDHCFELWGSNNVLVPTSRKVSC